MIKKTPWFDGSIEPFHDGPYEVCSAGSFQNWNGVYWGLPATSPEAAYALRAYPSHFQNGRWRGVFSNAAMSAQQAQTAQEGGEK